MLTKTSSETKTAASTTASSRSATPGRTKAMLSRRMTMGIAIGGAIAMIGVVQMGRAPSRSVSPTADAPPESASPADDVTADVATPPVVTKSGVRSTMTVKVRPANAVATPKRTATAATTAPVAKPALETTPRNASVLAPASPAVHPEVVAAVATNTATGAPVTITGCLEMSTDGDEFRLTDTEGAAAPKSRGWRSGFLKKSSAPVALVGVPDPRGSRAYVGHRVMATGLLTDRQLQVRSLQAAGSSCD